MANFQHTGRRYSTNEEFNAELDRLEGHFWDNCQGVCIHHTAFPHLAMRQDGFNPRLMGFLQEYYEKKKGWNSAPHLFIDEDEAHPITPMDKKGVHAVSFNASHIGLELLGDYDHKDDPFSGRGLQVWTTAARLTALILDRKGLNIGKHSVKFHRDDPRTNKTCPGKKVTHEWFLDLVAKELIKIRAAEFKKEKAPEEKYGDSFYLGLLQHQVRQIQEENILDEDTEARLESILWSASKMKG